MLIILVSLPILTDDYPFDQFFLFKVDIFNTLCYTCDTVHSTWDTANSHTRVSTHVTYWKMGEPTLCPKNDRIFPDALCDTDFVDRIHKMDKVMPGGIAMTRL